MNHFNLYRACICMACVLCYLSSRAQCPAEISLVASLSNVSIIEQASRSITASNQIVSGSVVYQAGNQIELKPGFEVKPGAVFSAILAGCETIQSQEMNLAVNAYPNPFTHDTVIEYALSESCRTSLKIFNLAGTEVKSLLVNELKEKGIYKIAFDSGNLSSGIYLCTLSTPLGQKVSKLIKL